MINYFFNGFRKIYYAWHEDNVSQIAAALSYYSIFSLIPLCIIIINMTNFFLQDSSFSIQFLEYVKSLAGENTANQIQFMINTLIQSISKKTYLMLLGILILAIAGLNFFVQLQNGLNQIWGVKIKSSVGFFKIIMRRILACIMVIMVTLLILISIILNTIIKILANYSLIHVPNFLLLNFIISFVLISLLFAILFKILPDVSNTWQDVWLGAMISSLLFTLGKDFIELYISKSNILTIYGASASFIIILVWIYYSAQILFLGAEISKLKSYKHKNSLVALKDSVFIEKNRE